MTSTWTKTFEPKKYSKLQEDIEADALVIGGGIAGTTALYLLAKAGKNAVMIEKASLAETKSAYTTAFLTNVLDTGLTELSNLFGEKRAAEAWRSHAAAIGMIERIVSDEKIECEFMRCDGFAFARTEKEAEMLREEERCMAKLGFDAKSGGESDDFGLTNSGFIVISNQAKFHPLKYLDGVRRAAENAGARIFESTEAKNISDAREESTSCVSTADGCSIWAEKIFIATHEPFNKPKEIFAHKGGYVTYVVEFAAEPGTLTEGIYQDEDSPYHYFRVDANAAADGRDRVILGGGDHRRELPLDEEKAYAMLEEYWKKIAPEVASTRVEKWSGPIIETLDGLAYIGTYSDGHPEAFLATGFSGNGMTYGTIAGMMFAAFADGRDVPWKDLYDPRRAIVPERLAKKGRDYAEEFVRGYGHDIFKSAHEDEKREE